APTRSWMSSPTNVAFDGSSTLTWTSTNATSCTASGDWTGSKATSGTAPVGPLATGKSYTLACTGAGGTATQTASVSVGSAPVPTLTLTASPTTVAAQGSSTLTWSSTNATG